MVQTAGHAGTWNRSQRPGEVRVGEQAHAQELRGCAVPPAEPHLEGRAAGNRWRVSEAVGIGEVHGQVQHVLTHGRDILKGDVGRGQACIRELV